MTLFSPAIEEQATAAQLAEIRRSDAEDRLNTLAAMCDALGSRGARKMFWEEYSEEIIHLSRVETHKGIAWTKHFLP
jgi:hypothetical protein